MLMQTHEARLDALRQELKRREIDGFIIPISDEHVSEYVGAYAQRLEWLTGFGGSAGSAAVLLETAAIFVDGRYTVQVREQVDEKLFEYRSVPKDTIGGWIAANASEGARIGYDAWLHSRAWVKTVEKQMAKIGATLVPVDGNPIDAVWQDQPEPSDAVAIIQDDENAGRSSAEKRAEIADWLKAEGHDAAVISALDSVAWLLNIRGSDIAHTPVALSYVIAHADGTAELFIGEEKVTPELTQHLGNAVTIRERGTFADALGQMAGKKVAVDPNYGVAGIAQALEAGGATVSFHRDPTILPRAIKNAVEQQGHRDAQARDGVAVSRFLRWIEEAAPSGEVDELAAAAKLLQFRRELGNLKDISFDTISAAAGHAALPHYKVDEDSNIPIPPSSIFLCDSGGQYPAGTTDITRTVWVGPGEPTAEMKDRFTRVLKGHIQIDRAIFPQGTCGGQLDAFARQYLWEAGVDYAHGTGHGVGSFLSVHEGPQRIAKLGGGQPGADEELFEGMILSNEPGYYKAGEFGIRIENLILTVRQDIEGAEGDYLGFECLTFVPIDRALVEKSLLTADEITWWNDYHAKVWDILSPQMEGEDLAWLERHCAKL
ncbi:MAG: aminopeptidase P family protein [Altererythrobacter sp.]|uniref:aminopeptidase P family protein n=1 Tax=Altererythrobacter sp. TaxID=1872480 RepID=UPI001B1495B0|nr:aminopeptidase P family protein [Altererythrobacter sp.]MBO6642445.1 aminopeptidase P family protein [Altererythrobacter sp.]MBO6709047.1 aminopeptidase P family protein [Altererythrobacter sp.]